MIFQHNGESYRLQFRHNNLGPARQHLRKTLQPQSCQSDHSIEEALKPFGLTPSCLGRLPARVVKARSTTTCRLQKEEVQEGQPTWVTVFEETATVHPKDNYSKEEGRTTALKKAMEMAGSSLGSAMLQAYNGRHRDPKKPSGSANPYVMVTT
jgi:hypothetical protein